MSTFLFASPVFGPVHSRRLGLSLGVNLLPADGKLCTFDCLYCECGFNAEKRPTLKMPSRELVAERLASRIRSLEAEGRPIDAITFAGNGEPTMHPEFPEIAADAVRIRDELAPRAKLCVLTNATNLLKPQVAEALKQFDLPMLKLDALNLDWIRTVNRPQCPYDLEKLVLAMKAFGEKCVIQTMFLSGEYEGRSVDNTTDDFVKPWLEALKVIRPKLVSIYSLDRDAPCSTIKKADVKRLAEIARLVEAAGIPVQASLADSTVKRVNERD